MRVYVDLFFLLNLAADLTLLAVAGRLCGQPLRAWRLLAGASFGGLYGIGALLLPWPLAFGPVGAAAAALLMLLAAFAPVPLRVALRLLAFFYGAGALLAGLTLLLSFGAAGGSGLAAGIPWWALTLALGACVIAGALAWDRWRPAARARWLCDLEVTVAGRRSVCRALVDTGNSLHDAAAADRPAVLVDARVLHGLIPAPLLASLVRHQADVPAVLAEVAAACEPERWGGCGGPAASRSGRAGADPSGAGGWASRLRFIPFCSVGGSGVIYGVRPDGLRVRTEGQWTPVRAVVGVSPRPLDPEAGYRALVPAAVMAEAAAWRRLPGERSGR